ncbi:MAG: efflux RND transporter permease subunit, partial [Planctomycetes bacterium]|nr:efflux RND transporter permease subunit [Planctomycetota bacterium]
AASDPKMMQKLVASEEGNLKTITGFTGWYISVLEVALKRPGRVLLLALAMLVGVQFAYLKLGKGIEFFPSIEPDFASVLVHARGNLSIYEQDELVKDVEDRILNVDGIKTMYTRIGKSQKVSDLAEDVIGQIQIEFTDWDTRKPAREILNEIRDKTGTLAGIFIEAREQKAGPAGGKAVEIQIASRFPEKLEPVTVQVLDILEELGDFRDVEDTRPLPGIEWELEVDRAQAAKFGMNITTIGYYIRMVTNGLKVAAYRPDDSEDEIDIVVRHGLEQRTLDQLDRIHIEGAAGSVPISSFVTRSAQPAVGVVYRSDQRRIVTVKADLPPGINVNAKVEKIKGWLSKHRHKLDPEVAITFKGQDEEQRDSEAFLIRAFIIALFIMAMILVTQFNSFYSAFLILTAVIMSTIGVMIGLIVTGQQFGIVMTGVGIIALAGIIVNNNIVLIDTFDHLNRQYGKSMNIREIILRTGAQRLRPVLLTTITTVIGLLPMVLQLNIDFISRKANFGAPSTQWWVQLSTAIVFGLTFSTVLTLVVTPSALMWRENIATTMGNLNKRLWKFIYKENSSLVPGKEK